MKPMDSETAKKFISGGKAIFTIENPKGQHFTYKVSKSKNHPVHLLDFAFISILCGPDNTRDYVYAGMLDLRNGKILQSKGSKVNQDTLSYRVAEYFLPRIWANSPIPNGYKVHHEGRCGRCGRLLTVGESVESGFGEDCRRIMGL